jgi:hypothetical protein
MAKKNNRDYPLPSSNGMFGGPGDPKKTSGDPKKTYTAQDSIQYMQTFKRFDKNVKKFKKYLKEVKKNPLNKNQGMYAGRIDNPIDSREQLFMQADSLSRSPFNKTFLSRKNKKK